MGDDGGPNALSRSGLRYIWSGRDWTVDSERTRWRTAWLTWAAVFCGLFSGVLLFGYLGYSRSAQDGWMVIAAGLLLCAVLLCLLLMDRIRSKPSVGVFYKRFPLEASSLDGLLRRAATGLDLELVAEEPGRQTRDFRRDRDVYRSYSIAGMGSLVDIVRRFRIRLDRVEVLSFIEMGPRGKGEDGTLDRLARAIDSADLHGSAEHSVDFGPAERRYRAWNGLRLLAGALVNVWFIIFLVVHWGLVRNATLVIHVEEYHTTLLPMMVFFLVVLGSNRRIIDLSRGAVPA